MDMRRLLWIAGIAGVVLFAVAGCFLFQRTEAVIDVSPSEGVVPLTVTFDGTRSDGGGGIDTYHWEFGTGDEAYEASGAYTYWHAGTFDLTLSVRTADGKTDVETVQIVVDPAVWTCDENLDKIYKLSMDGDVLVSFDTPVPGPAGITVADVGGQAWLYVACYGGGNQRILRVDPVLGTVSAEFRAPAQDPLYLTYGEAQPSRLWHLDGLSRNIYALNPVNGQVLSSFGTNYFRASQQVGNEVFLQSPQGLSWQDDGTMSGRLWYLEGETKLLYAIRIDPPINIFEGVQLEIDEEPTALDPSLFPVAGIDWYDGHLWVVDRDDHAIVQIDATTGLRTGKTIGGFPGALTSGLEIQQ